MKPIEVLPDFGDDGVGINSEFERDEYKHELHDEMEMTGHAFRHRLRIEGSSTMAPMMQSIVSAFEDRYVTWDRVDPELPMVKIQIFVRGSSTEIGMEMAVEHVIDFTMAARDLTPAEFAQYGEWKEAFKLASEALAIIVNAEHPMLKLDFYSHNPYGLPTHLYRDIFSGKIVTWDEVDSSLPAEQIHVYGRKPSGGASKVFGDIVMEGTPVRDDATLAGSALEMAENVAKDPWGIGYAGMNGVDKVNADGVKVVPLKFEGIEPAMAELDRGVYRLARPLLLITSDRLRPEDRAFIRYIFSEEGRSQIIDAGFLPAFKPGDVRQVYITSDL